MLRFFRNIRQKLIEQDKVRKYIWYAVGEILLVMIGILIALQVNNWNEERKDQQFVNFALVELYQDMSRDLDLIYGGIEPRLKLREKAISDIFEMTVSDTVVSENQFFNSYRNIDQGFTFSPIYGSYETLRQKGLDTIKDKELRKEIIDFYEHYLPRSVIFIHRDDADLKKHITMLERGFLERYIHEYREGLSHIDAKFVTNDFFDDQGILEVLDIQRGDASSKRRRVDSIKLRYNTLMGLLEEEFKEVGISYTAFDSLQVIPDF